MFNKVKEHEVVLPKNENPCEYKSDKTNFSFLFVVLFFPFRL